MVVVVVIVSVMVLGVVVDLVLCERRLSVGYIYQINILLMMMDFLSLCEGKVMVKW